MLNHSKILKRSLTILTDYKVLWLFGVLAALGARSLGNGSGYSFNRNDLGAAPGVFPGGMAVPGRAMAAIALLMLLLLLVAIVAGLAILILRYLGETALIRLVDEHEATGEKRSVGHGFRLGWSVRALRLFAIDLVIGVVAAIIFIALFLFALSPLLLWVTRSNVIGALGTVAAIGLVILVIVLAILAALAISLLKPFFWRKAALEDCGVFASMGEGYRMLRRHFRDAGVMWLILVGLQIGYGLVMIPVGIVLLILASVIAGVPALAVGGLAALSMSGPGPWILGLLVGVPIWLVVFFLPLLFISGLWTTYKSSVWTLTYRELRALESVSPAA